MTDFKVPKPTIQRIDGRLHLIREVKDDAGNVEHRVVMPLGVEFGLRDLAEIVVGATVLAIPVGYTEEVWLLGESLSNLHAILIVPFWVNEILRAFAFKIMFGSTGVINNFLVWIGLLNQPYDFIREDWALWAGLSYAFILLMIFPIYNAVENLDRNQIEAARDLGSPWWRIHWRVVIPHAKPGISSGCTMVFMLSAGTLAAPQILGGPSSLWFTQIIYQAFNQAGNWARGSAYALVLLITCIIFVLFVMKIFKVKLGEIAR